MQLAELFWELDFLTSGKDVNWTAFWLMMLFMYLNIILYMMDLYDLVKKKTSEETIMIMLLPGSLLVMGAILLTLFPQIPATADLDKIWTKMVSPGIWKELLCLAVLYIFLWCLTWLLWGRKRKNRLRVIQWILSYIPDLLMVVLLAAVGGAGLMGGTDLLVLAGRLTPGLGYNLVLCLFLYGVKIIVLKIALFLLAILTQFCSVRITRFPYREGRNPTVSFVLYGTLCQNSRVRGALAFWIPMLLFFTVWLPGMEEISAPEWRILFPLALVLGFLLYLLWAVRPLADTMERLSKWGDKKQVLARFCREYFLEEPILKTKDFTVTRHFLADERGMIEVYAFDALANVNSGWESDPKKGWVRQLSFLDGGHCTVCKNDLGAEEIFQYTKRYWETQRLAERGKAELQRLQAPTEEGLYRKLLNFALAALIMIFFMLYQMM